MPRPFTFVHAADLHIASPFKGLAGGAGPLADALRSATFAAFRGLVDLCLKRKVDFLLVAGDVYDAEDRSLKAQLEFRDGLERLSEAGIESFVVHGNHDPLDGRVNTLRWPERTHVFGAEVESVRAHARGDAVATVTGVSFPTKTVRANLTERFPSGRTDDFHIGLLHCNVGSNTGHEAYAPCEVGDLTRLAVDYWALGHVHNARILSSSPTIAYPGNLQGRSFRETGPRGCLVVEVDARGHVSTEPVALDVVRLAELQVSIGDLETVDQLQAQLLRAIEEAREEAEGRHLLCRARLTGRGALARELLAPEATTDLLEVLRGRFEGDSPIVWLQAILPECRPELDLAARRGRGDLVAEVLGVADELLESRQELADAVSGALAELLDHSRARKAIARPSEEQLVELVQAASQVCMDLLEGAS